MSIKNNIPLVSVGIPAFNRPNELKNVVQCVVNQSYKNMEIIIVDDNSNHIDSSKIYNSKLFKDPRIKLIRNKINNGVLKNANTVLKQAKGKYFCWISDDDWRSDVFIEKMVEDIEKLDNGYICFCDYREIVNNCQISRTHKSKKSKFKLLNQDIRIIRLISYYLSDHADGKCNLFYSLIPLKELKIINLKKLSSNWNDLAMDRNIVFQLLQRNKVHLNKSLLATLTVENNKFYKEIYKQNKDIKFNFNKLNFFINDIYKETIFSINNEKSLLRFIFLILLPIKIFLNLINRFFIKSRNYFNSSEELKAVKKIYQMESKHLENRVDLNNISLVSISNSRIEKDMMAMRYSMLGLNFKDNLFFSHYKPWNLSKKINYIKINPLQNSQKLNKFIFSELYKYINTDFILLINHRNFILNPNYWNNYFLEYDFITTKNNYKDIIFSKFNKKQDAFNTKYGMVLISKKLLLHLSKENSKTAKTLSILSKKNFFNKNKIKIFNTKTKINFLKLSKKNNKFISENNKLQTKFSFSFKDY